MHYYYTSNLLSIADSDHTLYLISSFFFPLIIPRSCLVTSNYRESVTSTNWTFVILFGCYEIDEMREVILFGIWNFHGIWKWLTHPPFGKSQFPCHFLESASFLVQPNKNTSFPVKFTKKVTYHENKFFMGI